VQVDPQLTGHRGVVADTHQRRAGQQGLWQQERVVGGGWVGRGVEDDVGQRGELGPIGSEEAGPAAAFLREVRADSQCVTARRGVEVWRDDESLHLSLPGGEAPAGVTVVASCPPQSPVGADEVHKEGDVLPWGADGLPAKGHLQRPARPAAGGRRGCAFKVDRFAQCDVQGAGQDGGGGAVQQEGVSQWVVGVAGGLDLGKAVGHHHRPLCRCRLDPLKPHLSVLLPGYRVDVTNLQVGP